MVQGSQKTNFMSVWLKLRYNRLIHQGKHVTFPQGIRANRMAYGRNGVGRHGLLCFNDEYIVKTTKAGQQITLTISTKIEGEAIAVTDEKIVKMPRTWNTPRSYCYKESSVLRKSTRNNILTIST